MERHHGDYGYDAPYALIAFAAAGGAAAMAAIASWAMWRDGHWAAILGAYSGFFLAHAVMLDMGCGRGAVLTAVARRLTSGRVTGIDVWNARDQSGNAREQTLRNASAEGVRDRVDVETGDMRALPFADGSFDVVLSSLAIHNIPSHEGRAQAIAEAWRVLKPGGRLAIADIRATARYAATLRNLAATDVARRGLGWRFWYGNPFAATSLVTATKPSRA